MAAQEHSDNQTNAWNTPGTWTGFVVALCVAVIIDNAPFPRIVLDALAKGAAISDPVHALTRTGWVAVAAVHVQVQRAAKALDDRDRTGTTASVTRCLGSLSVEALQCTRVDREHGAAEVVIPGKSIAKLEGKAQHPLSNWREWEHVVDEMRRTLRHPAAAAARAKAATLARERNEPIGAVTCTPKPGEAMREHAAANESLKLALHKHGGSALVLTYIELPEEGLKVLADDGVEHPMLRRATHVRAGLQLHEMGTQSRLVPLAAEGFAGVSTDHEHRGPATRGSPSAAATRVGSNGAPPVNDKPAIPRADRTLKTESESLLSSKNWRLQ